MTAGDSAFDADVSQEVRLSEWCGVMLIGVDWWGVAWWGVVWSYVMSCGVVWWGEVCFEVTFCGMVWCGVMLIDVVWRVRCDVIWSDVVWCGAVCSTGLVIEEQDQPMSATCLLMLLYDYRDVASQIVPSISFITYSIFLSVIQWVSPSVSQYPVS